jgi:prepilin-type N-terminal cleavage/methylation domain-containing protein
VIKNVKTLNIEKNEKGFTLIEIMIVVAIIGILSTIAVPFFLSYRDKAYDTTAKADLKNAMKFLDHYFLENDTYPATSDDLLAAGVNLSKDVSFTTYSIGTFGDGQPTVHIHIQHSSSSNAWHANYPKEGDEIEIR